MAEPPDISSLSVGDAQEWHRPAKRISDINDFDTMIIVFFGPMKQRFSFHQAKLCGRSKWFEAACATHRMEGRQPTKLLEHHLPDINVEVFREYWEWVDSGTISSSRCNPGSEIRAKCARLTLLVDLYKLGCSVQLEDVQLRNLVTLEVSRDLGACNIIPDQNLIAVVWSITPYGDCLRKLIVDFLVAKADEEGLFRSLHRYPTAFVHQLTHAALLKAPEESWQLAQGDGSRYRESEEAKDNT